MSIEKPYYYELQTTKELMSLLGGRATSGIMALFFSSRIYAGKVGFILVSNYLKETIPPEDRRALIITDSFTKKFADKVGFFLERIDMKYEVWSGALPEAPIPTIDEAVKICEDLKPTVIIGIGGGSVMDTSKIVMLRYEKPKEDIYLIMPFLSALGLHQKVRYLISIPTTSGTGSEVTSAAVATDTARDPPKKLEIMHDELIPDIAILDVDFVKDMPSFLTMATGMDAFSHAIGAFMINVANPLTDAIAVTAIKEIIKFLPRAYKYGAKDLEARQHMQFAATLAGLAFGNTMTGIDHALGHSFGKILGVHHGLSVGMFTPYALAFQAKITDKWKELCPIFGVETADIERETALRNFIEAIKKFMRSLNAPTCVKDIKELEIDREEYEKRIDVLANYSFEDGVTLYSLRPINEEIYKKIYEYAYDGKNIDF